MSVPKFPTFKLHQEARCFRCSEVLDGEPHDTGYPTGRWRQSCSKCDRFTFYDLDPFKPLEAAE